MLYHEDVIIPESPRVLSKEQVSLQVPVAGIKTPGLASFYDEHFTVIDGKVYLKRDYFKNIAKVPVNNLTLNTIEEDHLCRLQLLCNNEVIDEVLIEVGIAKDITVESRTVTPTKEQQVILPENSDYLSKVTVKPIPDKYIVPEGTLEILKNGPFNVADKEKVVVAVPDGDSEPFDGSVDVKGEAQHIPYYDGKVEVRASAGTKITDLSNTTWRVPSGWLCNANQATIPINCSINDVYAFEIRLGMVCNYNSTGILNSSSKANYISYKTTASSYSGISNTTEFYISFPSNSHSDALLEWLETYGKVVIS